MTTRLALRVNMVCGLHHQRWRTKSNQGRQWDGAFLRDGGIAAQRLFMDAAQTLPLLIEKPGTADVLDAMKVHRIRLAKDQGLRAWNRRAKRAQGILCSLSFKRDDNIARHGKVATSANCHQCAKTLVA